MISTDRLSVSVGGVELVNPIVCGAGEHMITAGGVRAAMAAGAGAVVVKSASESEAARVQLGHTDYALLDSEWGRLDWDFDPPRDASLLNRSGLFPGTFDNWIEMTSGLVAKQEACVVVPSIIPASYERAIELAARTVAETRCSVLEVNIGAPHAAEAAAGEITLEREADRVRELTASIRSVVPVPIWLKLTGQSDDVAGLAEAAFDGGADAVTIMGRFMAFLPDVETQTPVLGTMAAFGGGWALPLTCRWLALTRQRVGPARSLIATNGARTGLDVARFLLAGATAVQMNSAVFAGGFKVVARAVAELDEYLADRDDTAAGIVGRAADRLGAYTDQRYDPDYWQRFVPPEPRADG